MHTSKLSSQGQVTVPKAIREQLALHPGDLVSYEVVDGRVILEFDHVGSGLAIADDSATLAVQTNAVGGSPWSSTREQCLADIE